MIMESYLIALYFGDQSHYQYRYGYY